MKKVLFFLSCLFVCIMVDGQITFERTYGGPGYEQGNYGVQTNDGGYIIVGQNWHSGPGGWDIGLLKTDSVGNTVWTKYFGGIGYDNGNAVLQTNDTGYIIIGDKGSLSADVYLIKTKANGDTLWTRTFGGFYDDMGFSIAQTYDNGFIISGQTNASQNGFLEIYLIRTNANGDTLWTKTFGAA